MRTDRFTYQHAAAHSRGAQRGFTLIEMLISITIGLGILAGLVGVLASNASNSRSNDRTSELMTNGRYALNAIKHELREAGFRGYTWAEPLAPGALGVITNECLEAGAAAGQFISNIRQGVWGFNGGANSPFAANCIPDANYVPNTDVMVVRRLAATPTATASLVANNIYFHTTYDRGQMFRGVTPPTFTGAAPLASFAFQTFVYYIRPWTVTAAENPQIPALVRVALGTVGGNPTFTSELVASGIERMQVRYGRLTTTPDTQYLDTVTGASFSVDPTLSTDWEEVNSVRIWLLARNATIEPGYTNTTTYAMGDQPFTPNDGFRRQLFTTVVQLRN